MDLVKQYLDVSSSERSAILEKFILSLSDDEEQSVLRVICNKHDPLARLPVELIIRVFGYLHPYDIWSKRRVSRRWSTVLSSEDVVRSASARFRDHNPADSALLQAKSKPFSMTDEIRHVQSLRLARPFSSTYFRDDLAFGNKWWPLSPFTLKGRHIAYLQGGDGQSNKVALRDLTSGQTATLQGEAREKISGLTMTSELLAFVTYTGFLYTTSLADPMNVRKATRLPSSRVRCLQGDGGIVACLLHGFDEHTVVVHNATRNKTNSFSLSSTDLPTGDTPTTTECLIVDSAQETIDLLIMVSEERGSHGHSAGARKTIAKFGVQRLSFCGRKLKQNVGVEGHVWVSGLADTADAGFSVGIRTPGRPNLCNIRPAGRKGLFQLSTYMDLSPSVLYDSTTMAFARKSIPVNHKCDITNSRTDDGRTALWKDQEHRIFVGFDDRVAEGQLDATCLPFDLMLMLPQPHNIVCRPETEPMGHVCRSCVVWSIPPDHRLPPKDRNGRRYSFVEINDTFAMIVLPVDNIIQLLCFDERVQLHGSKPTGLWSNLYESKQAKSDAVLYKHRYNFETFDGTCLISHLENNEPVSKWEHTKWKMPYLNRSAAQLDNPR